MITVLTESGATKLEVAEAAMEELWLRTEDVEPLTGWELKPEGFCRGAVCIPVPPGREAEFSRTTAVNVAEFWRLRGGPVLHDAERATWILGEPATARATALDSLEAPDFTLPDLDGKPHSLVDYRGKKLLLATWASW